MKCCKHATSQSRTQSMPVRRLGACANRHTLNLVPRATQRWLWVRDCKLVYCIVFPLLDFDFQYFQIKTLIFRNF